MASIFLKRGKFWARIKGDKTPGKWSAVPTGETDKDKALRFAAAAQKAIDKRRGIRAPDVLTLTEWAKLWLVQRQEAGHDWRKDRGRLVNHVLPQLGELELPDLSTARVAELVHALRFKAKLAPRTVRNVYTVLASCLRDASIAGRIQHTPCVLTEAQLGSIRDKNPEWRESAQFTRQEVESLISDHRIPLDRQVVYGLGALAGLRIGEGGALRWRNYTADREPLGRLTIALAYATQHAKTKGTKTEAVRHVPVHPALASLLEHWRLVGWPAMFGRAPEPDDLLVPLPPEVKLVKRKGERFRGWDYTGRRWREIDLPALGWRHRSVYDTRATFITLALEDGADRDIIRDRVTHAKAHRDAFDGYDRGERWAETCREVTKLRIRRLVPIMCPENSISDEERSLRRRVSKLQSSPPELRVIQGGREVILSRCDLGMALMVASVCPRSDDDETMPEHTSPLAAKHEG
jgi:integrase